MPGERRAHVHVQSVSHSLIRGLRLLGNLRQPSGFRPRIFAAQFRHFDPERFARSVQQEIRNLVRDKIPARKNGLVAVRFFRVADFQFFFPVGCRAAHTHMVTWRKHRLESLCR